MRFATMLLAGSALAILSGVVQAQNAPSASSNSGAMKAPSSPSTSALPTANPAASGAATQSPQPAASLARVDLYFIQQANAGGAAEVDAAKLAQQKSSNSQVKDFAQTMIADHTKAADQLSQIVKQKGESPPEDMTKGDQEKQELSALSGRAFDRKYAEMQVKDHEDAIQLFQQEQQDGMDKDLKQFASSILPTLEHHLTMAKHLEAEVSGTASLSHKKSSQEQ